MESITLNQDLPIAAHEQELSELLAHHQVVIVEGETGSGKTTQLPQLALKLGRKSIGHTQPRRLAARSVASRIAYELGVELGTLVGYQVRFVKTTSRQTQIKVMTDGVLLNEITFDPLLRHYDTLIIDEAHERSLNIDFLLGYLKQLLPKRPELKVIITSATIDTARFSEHFGNAPVVSVEGRSYPVEVRYLDPGDAEQTEAIVVAAEELLIDTKGDILVFLSGEREIREAAEAIQAERWADVEVLPLMARLSLEEQRRVFAPHPGRRIVLATNVAETSLTVPGIRSVIDTGLARISRYSARTKVQRLPIEPISQASANQRAGRCGRLGPGVCIRLYSEEDFLARDEFTDPEILRTNLASVILQMTEAKLGAIRDFDFIDPPDLSNINDGLRLLEELGAIQGRRRINLTKVGHQLARLPVDPRMARMLVTASQLGSLSEVQILVAGLTVQDVRERPRDHQVEADQAHARFFSDEMFDPESIRETPKEQQPARYTPHTGRGDSTRKPMADPAGDFAAMLRLWRYLETNRKQLSGNQFRKLCRAEYLNYLRVREWQDLVGQLKKICSDVGLERNKSVSPDDKILIAILSGLLSQVGLAEVSKGKRQLREYLGARGVKFAIQPGSALAKQTPELVMAMELVETSRLWARTVAAIEPDWVELVGAHACRYSYSEPHFSSNSGSVLAREKVSLFGIPIIADRLVDYARINQDVAREIFIQSGLVEGQWTPSGRSPARKLIEHNRRLYEELEELEARSRRRDLIVDDYVIQQFYSERLPAEITSASAFEKWVKANPNRVRLSLDLLQRRDVGHSEGDFPDEWVIGELSFDVDYVFDPTSGSDGVTVTIPLAQLNQVSPAAFTWQVAGLRLETITELIRSLPKEYRRQLVPAPDFAAKVSEQLPDPTDQLPEDTTLQASVSRVLHQLIGIQIEDSAWQSEKIPAHLRVNFIITDRGKTIAESKDLGSLQEELSPKLTAKLTKIQAGARGTEWIFGDLPAEVDLGSDEKIVGYPALSDAGAEVVEIVLDSAATAKKSHFAGLVRLLLLNTPDPTRWVISHLTNQEKISLAASPYADNAALLADARIGAVANLLRRFDPKAKTRTEADFQRLLLQIRQEQPEAMQRTVSVAARTLQQKAEAQRVFTQLPRELAAELQDQLDNLVFEKFISFTPDPWYSELPKYVKALENRAQSYLSSPGKDAPKSALVREVEEEYWDLLENYPAGQVPEEVEEIGFLIEELRVQQFGGQLRTLTTVSQKRISKLIQAQK